MAGPGRDPTVSDAEILEVLQEAPDPVLTTQEVAKEIGLGRRGTYDRLKRLLEDGKVEMKKVGETASVWWYPRG